MNDSEKKTAWVTVAEAAEKAHVDSRTIRQWYRSGSIPTRRAEAQGGAFLVPLDLVLSLADPPKVADQGPEGTLRAELAAANEQMEFLRSQLAEASEESRSLRQQLQAAESRLLIVEAEATRPRGSITDHSWLDEKTPAYESPVRRQGRPVASRSATDAPAPLIGELTDLLASTRADAEDAPEPRDDHGWLPDEVDSEGEVGAGHAIWTDEAPRPAFGDNVDDLLPEHHEKKGRFGKK